jgi:peroxiredoxin
MRTKSIPGLRAACTLVLGAASLTGYAQKNSFTLRGSLEDMAVMPAKVYLVRDTLSGTAPDSAVVRSGKYVFRGSLETACPGYICTALPNYPATEKAMHPMVFPGKDLAGDNAAVFLDKGDMTVVSRGKLGNTAVTGSVAQAEAGEANRDIRQVIEAVKGLAELYHETEDQLLYNKITETIFKMEPLEKTDYTAFIRRHPDAAINPYLLNDLLTMPPSAGFADTLQSLYASMPETLRTGKAGTLAASRLGEELKSAIGHEAKDFTLPDTLGQAVHLASYRGKYVLVHFWESGDPSTAISLSYLSRANHDYRDKGLVVIGVSLDTDKDQWLKSIRGMHLAWTQVSDLAGWSGQMVNSYGIHNVPRNILIGPGGIIIARDLSYSKVDEVLSPIFE